MAGSTPPGTIKLKRKHEAFALKNLFWRTPFIVMPGNSASFDISDYTKGGIEAKGRPSVNEVSVSITEPHRPRALYKVAMAAADTAIVLDKQTLIPVPESAQSPQSTVQSGTSSVAKADQELEPFRAFVPDSQILIGLHCYLQKHDHSLCYLMAVGYVKGERPILRFTLAHLLSSRKYQSSGQSG